jgi:hypothetical protein
VWQAISIVHENTDIGWHRTGQCRSGNDRFRSASATAETSFNPSGSVFLVDDYVWERKIKKIVGVAALL